MTPPLNRVPGWRQRTGAKHCGTLLLALACVCQASGSAPGSEEAERALQERGLKPKASFFLLDSEVEFSRRLSALRKVRVRLDDARKNLEAYDKLQHNRRNELRELLARRSALSQELAEANSIERHNRVARQYNAMLDRIALIEESLHDEELREHLQETLGEERREYLEVIAKVRGLADSTQAAYAALGQDPVVVQSLAVASEGRKRPYLLGPRPNFAKKLEQLEDLELAVQSDRIPLRFKNGIYWVDVTLDGRVTKAFVLDTGASGIMLPSGYAAELGLVPGPDDPEYTFFVADGRSVTAKLMHLDSVSIGEFEVQGLPCVVLPPEMTDAPPLLGITYLRHFVYSIDAGSKSLTLSQVKR